MNSGETDRALLRAGGHARVLGRPRAVRVFWGVALVVLLASIVSGQSWKQATAGYRYQFPGDHASHPEFKIEWWYYTGNVQTTTGRRLGYQLTFFRVGVDPSPANPSRWAVRDLYMTHLAVSDPQGQRYRYAERLSRGGPGLAGADVARYRVWNEDWTASLADRGRHRLRAMGGDQSRASERSVLPRAIGPVEVGVDLELEEGKPPVVNGVDGISQKGSQPGNASHYYSLTRMPTRGTIVVDGERFDVTGLSWMDHEFGTSFLEPEQRGWDWLSLQLNDGRELMLYQLRRSDDTKDPRSSGTLVERDGRSRNLTADDFAMEPTASRVQAPSGASYPLGWTISVPSDGLTLRVSTPLPNQELSTKAAGISYWEGLVGVKGARGDSPVEGRGYLEMTGYRGSLGRVLSGQ